MSSCIEKYWSMNNNVGEYANVVYSLTKRIVRRQEEHAPESDRAKRGNQ